MTNHEELPEVPPESPPESENLQRLPQSPPGEPGPFIELRIDPFPPPAELRQYEQILSGFTDRRMTFIENEQRAQIKAQDQMSKNERLRINGSVLVTSLSIISGVVLAWLGYPLQGVALGLGGTLLKTIQLIVNRFFNGQG